MLPHQTAIPRVSSSFDGGDLVSEDLREQVGRLDRDAVAYANTESELSTFESDENVGADD